MTSPREDAQDTFISLTGTLYVIVSSRKDKGTCTVMLHLLKYVPGVQKYMMGVMNKGNLPSSFFLSVYQCFLEV